ncbi:hypothetical protein [Pseudomonas aeruginosa]|uniref:hypothetical protein n=1 Tax=Pseudomonas aeruginosa TaxID=287 RepID=UPI00053D02AF|nr:hypothetical protein [Pseudomonas aeruginosa]
MPSLTVLERYGQVGEFAAAWLQSRFALTTEEAERVVLQLLDQGVIVLEQENEESRELNTYRVVKKPGDIALDLE